MSAIAPTKTFDSKTHESFPRFCIKNAADLRIYRFALYNFVANSLRMRYRRSALGFVWSLLNPLLTMFVISVVFSLVYKQDLRIFSIYVFSGLAPWNLISTSAQAGSMSIIYAEGFLKKVYLPKLLFPVVTVSTETVNFLFSLVSMYLLALIIGAEFSWRMLLLPFVIAITYIFVLGIAVIVSVATVYFRDLTQIIMVMMTALFYCVPIIYPIEQIPADFHWIFYINPFYYFIMLYRKIIFYISQPLLWTDWAIPLGIGLITLLFGLLLLMKHDRDIIYRL